MIKKVVLINPPQVFSKTFMAAGVIPPLGLMYLGAVCQKAGYEIQIIDSIVEAPNRITKFDSNTDYRGLPISEIVKRCKNADVIGITNLFSFAFPIINKLVDEIKNNTTAPIILGGAHVSAMPKEVLENSKADYVIIGEGESIFLDLLSVLNKKKEISCLHSIAYKSNKGIITIPRTSYIKDIDTIPFPARDLVALEKYYNIHEAHGPSQSKWTPILSSRGCPFQCTFCTSSLWDRQWRARSAKNIVDEIEFCMHKYGIKEFHFEDENMTLDKRRVLKICDEIIKRRLKIKWQTPNGIRASVTDKETLVAMKKAGCYHITIAPESGSQYVLNHIMNKQQDIKKVLTVVKATSAMKLKTAGYFMLGLPGERISHVNKTIKLANKLARLGLDEVAFSPFIPYPGSTLFDKLKKENRIIGNWAKTPPIGHFKNTISWSEYITNKQLLRLKTKGYVLFHINKAIYHPMKTLTSVLNILRRKETLKTERTLITFLKRLAS